jgi:hypothetical protein
MKPKRCRHHRIYVRPDGVCSCMKCEEKFNSLRGKNFQLDNQSEYKIEVKE